MALWIVTFADLCFRVNIRKKLRMRLCAANAEGKFGVKQGMTHVSSFSFTVK